MIWFFFFVSYFVDLNSLFKLARFAAVRFAGSAEQKMLAARINSSNERDCFLTKEKVIMEGNQEHVNKA